MSEGSNDPPAVEPISVRYNINPTFVDWDTAPLPPHSYESLTHIRIVLLGLIGSGKRQFLKRLGWSVPKRHAFHTGRYECVVSGTITDPAGVAPTCHVEICSWDVDRQSDADSQPLPHSPAEYELWRSNWRMAHAVIWMVDASDPDRLDGGWCGDGGDRNPYSYGGAAQRSRREFDETIRDRAIRGKPILVVCNKFDVAKVLDTPACHLRMGLPLPVLNDGWSNNAITRDRLLPIVHDCLSAVISVTPLRVLITEYALGSVEDLQSGFVRCEPMVCIPYLDRFTPSDPADGRPPTNDQLDAVRSLVTAVHLRSGLEYQPPRRNMCTLM